METYRKCEIELLKVMKLVLLRFSLGKSGNGNPREREREKAARVDWEKLFLLFGLWGLER